ncbi:MAG: hypothetical protein IKC38_06050 [Clostridia bacterium]|nr:hypothetical protein [Clostridia bacterium]
MWTIIVTIALIFGMSAAWYTNVLQTSGLQFQAEAWGFNGKVLVTDAPTEAGPGDTGIVGLTVTNSSDDLLYVAVNLSKTQMTVPMQQRLYFYVDIATESNGESLDRVYINTQKSYTYSLLAHSELVLTEKRSNDAMLKWQWVYDMEGYYFLGSLMETTDSAGNVTVVPTVEDYLRPVEYDLDTAIFSDGFLTEANGKPLDQFVKELSETDGYAGDITPGQWQGYYKVDVDENGYGIWMYICNWAEIQQATIYDTQLGKTAAQAIENGTERENYLARLTFTGQVSHNDFKEVSTAEEFIAALNEGGMIKLSHGLELSEPIVVNGGAKAVVDLAGCTITGPSNNSTLVINDGSELMVMNGSLVGTDGTQDVITVSGSSLTLSGVNITGESDDAIYVVDQGSSVDSCVRIFNSEITASSCAVYMRGNGSSQDGYTQVIIENSTLTSDYMAVLGNGTQRYWGTDVQIYQSTIHGYYAAVYQPQGDSITRITESTVSGLTGVVIKGGDLVVADSTVMGTSEQPENPTYLGSGFSDTGDGIYIECGYANTIHVTVEGEFSNIISKKAQAVRVFEPDSVYANVFLKGGAYSSDVTHLLREGYSYDASSGIVSAVKGASNE